MSKDDKVTEEDRTLMVRYGITCAPKMMCFYKQYRYENLTDAFRYGESETKRTQKNTLRTPTE